MAGLLVVPIRHRPFWNFSYLLACEETREAVIIDPAWDAEGILRATQAHEVSIRQVVLTHTHSDHANAVGAVVAASGAGVFAHSTELAGLGAHFDGAASAVSDGELLRFGRIVARVLHTPGHSPGSLSLLAEGRLFCGDTLNIGSVGRPGPGTAAVDDLWRSVRAISELAPETVIHPGHDEGPARSATLAEELARNPAFTAQRLEEFVAMLERATGYSRA